jgi:hypothetical protein
MAICAVADRAEIAIAQAKNTRNGQVEVLIEPGSSHRTVKGLSKRGLWIRWRGRHPQMLILADDRRRRHSSDSSGIAPLLDQRLTLLADQPDEFLLRVGKLLQTF